MTDIEAAQWILAAYWADHYADAGMTYARAFHIVLNVVQHSAQYGLVSPGEIYYAVNAVGRSGRRLSLASVQFALSKAYLASLPGGQGLSE